MRHGSLFSGIGGFDLAADWLGWTNSFHCEINPFGRQILSHYWPEAESYDDIIKTDFSKHRGEVDIITGGFPCQPFSTAGKRKGTDDPRHLWPRMLEVIRDVSPSWVVGENVRGIVNWSQGMVFEQVQVDLESLGYSVTPFILPACGIGAPHKRDRVWFVAHSDHSDDRRITGEDESKSGKERLQERDQIREPSESGQIRRDASDTNSQRFQRQSFERGSFEEWKEREEQPARFIRTEWKEFPTQPPLRDGDDGIPSGLDRITVPKWRNETIKAGGNAIVPQVAFQIFSAIQEYEDLHSLS